jgi:hypothetical protein
VTSQAAPGPQRAQHPLVPLTLLDEFPPAGSVPVLGLLRIHRHETTRYFGLARSSGMSRRWLARRRLLGLG